MTRRILEKTKDGHEGLKLEGDKLYRYRVQNTDPYYKENKFWRNNIGKEAITRRWALPVANIPFADYQNMLKANPELKSSDPEIRTKAWLKTLKQIGSEQIRTVTKNLIPDNPNPDIGSIILPSRLQKCQENSVTVNQKVPDTNFSSQELTVKVDPLPKQES